MSPRPRLIAFDVDGTLIESPDGRVVWQLLNQRFGGTRQENNRRYRAYMQGEITYREWVDLDVGGWRAARASRDQLAAIIRAGLAPTPGAVETVRALRARGHEVVVISGTLDITLELLLPGCSFAEVYTNRIWFEPDGQIAGWEATPYDMEGKAEALIQIAAARDLPLSETAFIGDNINDIKVMEIAGLAVAFNPKAASVERAADVVVRQDLRGVLELLG